MVEWVLDTRYRNLFDRDRWSEESILVYEAGESQLIRRHGGRRGARITGVKVFSLPSMGDDGSRRHVELGVRGDPEQVRQAIEALRKRGARRPDFPFRAQKNKARLSAGFLRLPCGLLGARSGLLLARFGA